jgi:hypothetical protein
MGLIGQIVTLPLAPARGAGWVVEQVMTAAEQEYYDPGPVQQELKALEQELLEDRITEEEFDSREDELLDRLEWIQHERARLGLDS